MKMILEIPDYSPEVGLTLIAEQGLIIESRIDEDSIIIKANNAGLVSLARHLLALAQPQVPKGSHVHYDDFHFLKPGSVAMIIEKVSNKSG